MLKEKEYAVDIPSMGLGYKPPSPVHIAIRRAITHYIIIKEEIPLANQRKSVFDRLGNTPCHVSVFNRLGPKRKNIRRPVYERLIFAKMKSQIFKMEEDKI